MHYVYFLEFWSHESFHFLILSGRLRVVGLAEASAEGAKLKGIIGFVASAQVKLQAGLRDPETKGPACGVAIATRSPLMQAAP